MTICVTDVHILIVILLWGRCRNSYTLRISEGLCSWLLADPTWRLLSSNTVKQLNMSHAISVVTVAPAVDSWTETLKVTALWKIDTLSLKRHILLVEIRCIGPEFTFQLEEGGWDSLRCFLPVSCLLFSFPHKQHC